MLADKIKHELCTLFHILDGDVTLLFFLFLVCVTVGSRTLAMSTFPSISSSFGRRRCALLHASRAVLRIARAVGLSVGSILIFTATRIVLICFC